MNLFSNTFFRKMAKILDGKALSMEIKNELKRDIEDWVAKNHKRPKLTCILVGDDPASATYVRNKMEAAKFVGKI